MSQEACFGNFSPIPSLGPEGQWKRQREHGDIEEANDKTRGKRVRFKDEGAPPNPVEPSCSEEDVELCVISWNINNKLPFDFREEFLELGAHIWIVQEGNRKMENMKKWMGYRWFTMERSDKQLMIGVVPNIQGRRREEMETPNSMVVEIYLGNCSILIGNIHQTEMKGEYRVLLEKLQDTLSICGGDLNSKPRRDLERYHIVSDMISRRRKNSRLEMKNKNSDFGSKIDFIFLNKGIRNYQKNKTNFQYKKETKEMISDHKPLSVTIRVNKNDGMKYPVVDAKKARSHFSEWDGKQKQWKLKEEFMELNLTGLIEEAKLMRPEDGLISFRSPKYQEWNEEFQKKLRIMERCEKGKYHKFIQHTTQMRADKEGGIVNIMKMDDGFITCYKQILHECIEKMMKVSGVLEEGEERPWRKQRKLEKDDIDNGIFETLNWEKVVAKEGEYIEWYNKAVSFDFLHLTPIRLVIKQHSMKRKEMDWSLFDLDVWQSNDYCMAQRLIPLNKVAPKIAGVDDVRPIMVQSHLVKYMEWMFIDALKNINNLRLDPCQVGFTSKLGTQVHICKIISRLKTKGEGKSFVFFDLSDAYNTINREALYGMIALRRLIDEKRLDFLLNCYDSLYVYDPVEKKKIRFKNGVQQGSALSPFLFNIFFEEVIKHYKLQIRETIEALPKNQVKKRKQLEQSEILAYADDVVIFVHKRVIAICANTFLGIAEGFKLKTNLKKTKYLANREIKEMDELQIEKVKTFRYLGVWLSIRGDLKHQLELTKRIVMRKSQQLAIVRKIIPFRSITKLWILYILPHIRYHNLAIWKQSRTIIERWQLIKRNSFRRVLGINKGFPKNILDGIIGRLEFDVREGGYIRRQLRIDIFRRSVQGFYPENFMWYQAIQLYNFVLWKQFEHMEMEEFDLGRYEAQDAETLFTKMKEESQKFIEGTQDLEKQIDYWEKMEIKISKEKEKGLERRFQGQVIRRIPEYDFFEPYKHSWRTCLAHGKNMTAKHMLEEHLFGEPGGWMEKMNKIQEHIGNTMKPFYSKVQKSMREHAKKLAERIRKLIKSDCEPYKGKQQPSQ